MDYSRQDKAYGLARNHEIKILEDEIRSGIGDLFDL